MKIGRQDRPAEALVVEGWPIICIGVGEGIESFWDVNSKDSQGSLITITPSHPNASLDSVRPRATAAAVLLALFRAPRTQSCCFPLMRASYISLSMHPPVSAVGPALKHVRLRVSNGICTQV